MRTDWWPVLAGFTPRQWRWPHSQAGARGFLRSSEKAQKKWHQVREKTTLCPGTESANGLWESMVEHKLSTFPNAVVGHLELLGKIVRGNNHMPSLLLLFLCQSWQILVWNICRHGGSSLLQKLFGAGQRSGHTRLGQNLTQWTLSTYATSTPWGHVTLTYPMWSLCWFCSP